ncbi:MAG: SAVED domain-containing protein [Oscillochloris sp.]|nr:SAVED domain-containing protein [Oscillochloris sp.]
MLRYVPSTDLRRVNAVSREQLRVVAAIASPSNSAQFGLQPFDTDAERQRAATALRDLPQVLFYTSGSPTGRATPDTLLTALQRGCDMLYIVCHGALVNGQALLWLENDQGEAAPLGIDAITRMLRSLPADLRPLLVVIGACHSAGRNDPAEVVGALAPQLARDGVPAVLAMQGFAPAKLIERYLPSFLQELVRSGRIDQAAAMARLKVPAHEAWLPALYLRSQDGRLWDEHLPVPPPIMVPITPPLATPLTIALLVDEVTAEMAALRTQLQLRGFVVNPGDDDDAVAARSAVSYAAAAILQVSADRLDDDPAFEKELAAVKACQQADPAFSFYTWFDGITEKTARRAGVNSEELGAIGVKTLAEPHILARRILKQQIERRRDRIGHDQPLEIGISTFAPQNDALLYLDWQSYLAKGQPEPSIKIWQTKLLPALHDLHTALLGRVSMIRLHIAARNSMACAFGYVFRATTNIRLQIPQRDGDWDTRPYEPWAEAHRQRQAADEQARTSVPVGEGVMPLVVRVTEIDPNGSDITIELPLTQNRVMSDVDTWIANEQPALRRRIVLEKPAEGAFAFDADTMHNVACQVRHTILQYGASGTVHLIGAIPAALAALIGWHLNTCEPVQCYELERNTVLKPSCLLQR